MLQPGDTIDIWVVEAALGSGGMGSVYRCHNRAAKRILAAVKVLDGTLKRYPEAEARFIREADILGQLDHPNIVKVRNVRPDADPPYIEMEFVAGVSLDERLRQGPVPYTIALPLMRQCAEALAYIHGMGICHRDIKPANLIVDGDRLKLVDFGLAVEERSTRITQHGVAFGTVSYAPPEWIVPEVLDPPKWDVYALGVVFFELLTGQLAFPVSGQGTARQQAMQVIVAKQGHAPLDPGDAFHDDVRELIGRMTASAAEERLADAAQVASWTRRLNPSLRRAAGVTLAPMHTDRTPFDLSGPPTTDLTGEASAALARAQSTHAQSAVPAEVPRRRLLSRGLWVAAGWVGVAALGVGLLGATAVGGGVMVWLAQEDAPRDVRISVNGAEAPVDLELAGRSGVPADGGFTFAAIPTGEATARWVVGDGCTVAACPSGPGSGTCAAWCVVGERTLAVIAGQGPLVDTIDVAPAPRLVDVALPALADDVPVSAGLGAVPGTRTPTGISFQALPGRHPLWIAAGDCPEESRGCADACPPGCASVALDLTVPVEGPPEPSMVGISAPPPPIAPEPAPTAAAEPHRRRRHTVTNAELAVWLADHPDWAPGGKFQASNPGRYLIGWTGATPPEGKGDDRPRGVTPNLAQAYCNGQGGLPGVDVPVPGDGLELREGDDGSVYLVDAADTHTPAERAVALSSAAFRCR